MLETLKAHGRIEESLLDSINEYLASMAKVAPTPAPAAAQKPQGTTKHTQRRRSTNPMERLADGLGCSVDL
jgi:hypothetical protein